MGEASRRKKQRRDAGAGSRETAGTADPRLTTAARELREALVARARAIRAGVDDTSAADRVREAAATVGALMAEDDESADRLMRGMDGTARLLVATAAAIATALQPDPAEDEAVAVAMDGEAEAAAEQLMAFEELPLGSRLGAVVNEREIALFVGAAITALGPRWDPFDPDPLGLHDIGAVAAGLAVVRATLLVSEALADPARVPEMRDAIAVAGTAISATQPAARDLLSDDAASAAWLLARAFATSASAPEGSAQIVRRVGPQLPLAFAAGAAGADWAAALDTATLFSVQVRQLEEALAAVPAGGLRGALDAEFVLAAYAAGLAWRGGRGGEWRDPWDLTGPVAADLPA